jgi:hypothetical protein
MAAEIGSYDWLDRNVREWLLLLLRFAITQQPSDRSAACGMAEQLDSLGTQGPPSAFHFFRRTSEEVCRAIVVVEDSQSDGVLRRHLARIDDPRLRRAFQAAVGVCQKPERVLYLAKGKERKHGDLWKGLRTR